MQPRIWVLVTIAAIVIALGVYPYVQDSRESRVGESASAPVVSQERIEQDADLHSDSQNSPHIETPLKAKTTDAVVEKNANNESQRSDAQFDEKVKALQNRSDDDLEVTHHADGSVSANMSDRYRNVPTARLDKDGNVKVEQ
ncbi:MAG: hypothetical protein P1U67_01825 [Alcanivoracaceae bacterium]|nr:hypothetical protein [Alcanivoracaceae bacterium]